MGELGALFNPGMRHELAERQAKAARREEEGNARDGDLRIDLESGVAVINVAGPESDEAVTEVPVDAADVDSEPAASAAASATEPVAQHEEELPEGVKKTAAHDGPPAPAIRPRGKRGLSHSAR